MCLASSGRPTDIQAYIWAMPAILAAGKGRGGMFLHFHSFSFLPYPSL